MKQPLVIIAIISLLLMVVVSGCSILKTGTPAVTPITTGFIGVWDTNFNQLTITANGNTITGTYGFRNGTLSGTASGNTLTGTWTQSYSDNPDSNTGDCVLVLSSDGQSFTGNWRYGHSTDPNAKWDGSWTGTKI
jgi:hypothetical protein